MDLISPAVKPKRRYDASRRRQQALRSRQATLDAARHLFLADGYAVTSIASIAQAADVSVETIYKAFGGKSGLVRALWEQGLAGSGPIPAEQRSDEIRSLETDPRAVIQNWGRLTVEVAPLVAPILLLIRTAAATDPELGRLQEEVDRARLTRMEINARSLHARSQVRQGITLQQATDVLWTYSSPELFELLVLRRGWSPEQYGAFIAEGMIAALLPPE
jgi:AcrR family transcriptional regulator